MADSGGGSDKGPSSNNRYHPYGGGPRNTPRQRIDLGGVRSISRRDSGPASTSASSPQASPPTTRVVPTLEPTGGFFVPSVVTSNHISAAASFQPPSPPAPFFASNNTPSAPTSSTSLSPSGGSFLPNVGAPPLIPTSTTTSSSTQLPPQPPPQQPTAPPSLFESDLNAIRALHSTAMQPFLLPHGGTVPGPHRTRYDLTPSGGVPSSLTPSIATYPATLGQFRTNSENVLSRFQTLSPTQQTSEIDAVQALAAQASAHSSAANFIPPVATHQQSIRSLYHDATQGGGIPDKQFNDRYRDAAPAQDEHLSTALTRNLVHAAHATAQNISDAPTLQRFHSFGQSLLEYTSAHRAPTSDTVFPIDTPSGVVGTQHPTGGTPPPLPHGRSAHNYSDRQRAESVDGSLNLAAAHSQGVLAPFVAATAVAQVNTLNTLIAPLTAINASPTYTAQPGVQPVQQHGVREAVKRQASSNPYFSNPSSTTTTTTTTQSSKAAKKSTDIPSPPRTPPP